MIELQHVTFTYPDGRAPALNDVSLVLAPGGMSVITGPSGCGKSTLLRCLNGLVPHYSGGHMSGRIRVAGQDPIAESPHGMARHVGMVQQDPEAQFVMDVVEDEIAFALETSGLSRSAMRMRVEETLDLLQLVPLRRRQVLTLSGGEKQKVVIAAALALRPDVLILDEPTSQLDPQSAETVLTALAGLNNDLGLTILLSEHRLDRVLQFADTLIVMRAGAAITGPTAQLAGTLAHPPPIIQIATAMGWSPLPLTIKRGRAHSERTRLAPAPAARAKAPARPILEVIGVTASHGTNRVLNHVSLIAGAGELTALMGRNGSGKSTLLRSIVGLQKVQHGSIRMAGHDISRMPVAERCRHIAYLPQDPNAMLFAPTVRDEVAATLRNHQVPVTEERGLITRMLETLGIDHLANAYPRDLSTGERQRVALAAILVTNPIALLLDEPTRGLDGSAKHALGTYLISCQARGLAIVLVTHDTEFAAELADRVIVLASGEVIADGSPHDVLAHSPVFSTQVAKLFPGSGWLTATQVLATRQPASQTLSAENQTDAVNLTHNG